MCGIFSYIKNGDLSNIDIEKLINEYNKIQHRGPDNSSYITRGNQYMQYGNKKYINKIKKKNLSHNEIKNMFIGFHRLSINDLSENGNQPFISSDNNTILICNGEIYNFKELANKYDIQLTSNSDCEIILQLYLKIGFIETIKQLDGVFACFLYNKLDNIIHVARDPIGVRSLFMGVNINGDYGFCSELKGISSILDYIEQFKPGCTWNNIDKKFIPYYECNKMYKIPQQNISNSITNKMKNLSISLLNNIDIIKKNIKDKLLKSITKRLVSDRPIGCLLSGGLDSSLVAALLSNELQKSGKILKTFSVGLKGSIDLKYAKLVADYIKSDHHELILTEEEMLNGIDATIYQLETWDTTTIRAGTPMFLLSKYIKANFNTTVIYSGEGSDESSGSYLYFHNAPSCTDFKDETIRLMEDLSYFDVLRCDKSVAGAGLEVRVPFLDKDFLHFYMNINSKYKIPSYGNIEKYLLRSSFDYGLLPNEVLWRVKEGMSDGVSSQEKSWFQIIQSHANNIYSDVQFNEHKKKYFYNQPHSKESLWFREIFNKYYTKRHNIIPYYWLPKWSNGITEASARVLNVYSK